MSTLDNAEKLMWKYLLMHGSVVESKSYYGNTVDFNKAAECREVIKDVGIDWGKTNGVRDDYDMTFNGTFDEPAKVTFLEGTLVTNDGKEWAWIHEYDEPINILSLIADIIPDPFEK